MKEEELSNISGGGMNASLLNAIIRGTITIYELGKALGSAIRYGVTGKRC